MFCTIEILVHGLLGCFRKRLKSTIQQCCRSAKRNMWDNALGWQPDIYNMILCPKRIMVVDIEIFFSKINNNTFRNHVYGCGRKINGCCNHVCMYVLFDTIIFYSNRGYKKVGLQDWYFPACLVSVDFLNATVLWFWYVSVHIKNFRFWQRRS